MPPAARPDWAKTLATLVAHGVEFIVVGGVAAVLHGAPIATRDLDIVHRRTSENVERLRTALDDVGARYRHQGDRVLAPGPSHLASEGHQLLRTRYGHLDLLGKVAPGHGYEELVGRTITLDLEGMEVRVVDLPTLIELKESLGRPRDVAHVAQLRAIERLGRA